ncbi:MAG: hypothetical protein HFJ34_01235 [Clostridia bacterium]|nr:hypothetical protein [Clostridia bacterium]
MSKSGIVNVRMVITEEKMLCNIDKIQKLINPKSKKQIVQLEDDSYFKDLIESIKMYLIEYPKKKNFPASVYKAAYGLVEFATNQFEENTKKIEELIRQREQNIGQASQLKELLQAVEIETREKDWKEKVKKAEDTFSEDMIDTLTIIGKAKKVEEDDYEDAVKLINARINNLETNLHIEIDMERIEDRSKALSYIGIEIADALKSIPTPIEEIQENKVVEEEKQAVQQTVETPEQEPAVEQQYAQETTFEAKPSLWQRIKNSKFIRAMRSITKIRIVLDYSEALPEGRGENAR